MKKEVNQHKKNQNGRKLNFHRIVSKLFSQFGEEM